ncbi:MAG: trypsin-like peptidase domain-containing protein [Nitrososphaerota archaeon]|nr:trypsin-like peptidase domain-containing protein [Nitrososphaerota archaeon]
MKLATPMACSVCRKAIQRSKAVIFGQSVTEGGGETRLEPLMMAHEWCVKKSIRAKEPPQSPSIPGGGHGLRPNCLRLETIHDLLYLTTTQIEVGDPLRPEVGTGFFVSFSLSQGEPEAKFLVTNRHVAEAGAEGRFSFRDSVLDRRGRVVGAHLRSRRLVQVPDWRKSWVFHPNRRVDVAILPVDSFESELVARGRPPFVVGLSETVLSTPSQDALMDSVEDLLFVGYPESVHDKTHFLPVARKAISATPIGVSYERLPAFLVDATIYPGASGSPVFVAQPGAHFERGQLVPQSRFRCVGLLAEGFSARDFETAKRSPIPTARRQIHELVTPLGLALAFRSSTITETVAVWARRTKRSAPRDIDATFRARLKQSPPPSAGVSTFGGTIRRDPIGESGTEPYRNRVSPSSGTCVHSNGGGPCGPVGASSP